MADFGSTVKNIWMKGMEAIGNTATNIANNTKFKVDEMNMVNRRAEILADFGSKAYALWQKGEKFPEELEEQLAELKKLDEKLNDMRAERYAGVKTEEERPEEEIPEKETADGEAVTEEETEASEAEEAPEEGKTAAEETEAEEAVSEVPAEEAVSSEAEEPVIEASEEIPVIKVEKVPEEENAEKPATPLSDAINDLFEKIPSKEEVETKVNSALDSLGQSLQEFSKEIDEGLSSLTDKIKNDDKE